MSISSKLLLGWNLWMLFFDIHVCEGVNTEVHWESEVINKILLKNTDYVREARPAKDVNQSVEVTTHPFFLRVESLDEATNSFTASLIFMQIWTDSRLAWNSTDYGGVIGVRLPSSRIWIPDIVPYNSVLGSSMDPVYEETAYVTNEGRVNWGPLMRITSDCQMDLTNFPMDSQLCSIFFGSWLHSVKEMQIVFYDTKVKEMEVPVSSGSSVLPHVGHPNWNVVNGKITVKIFNLKFGESEFCTIGVTAHVERRSGFYKYLAVSPGALLGFLVPVMFLMPARSKQKNTFGMLLVIGLILLISILAEAIPLSHVSTPRVGVFYLISLMLVCFSILLSIFVSNISHRGARRRPLPQWIHRAFLSRNGLRRVLCIDKYSPVDNLFAETMREVDDHSDSVTHVEPVAPGTQELENTGKLASQIKDTNKYLRYICGKMSADDSYKNVNSDWEELARVIDRVLFIIFAILYALTAVALLA